MIVALSLSPSLDVTYEVDALRPGGIVRPSATTRVAGGKALNAARAARSLGADVRAIVALGGHSGAWVAELLAADGVEASVVDVMAPTRTCLAIVDASGAGSSTDVYEPAGPLTDAEWSRFAALASSTVEPGCWVVLSGSVPEPPGGAAVGALLRDLRARGARVAVDSSGAGLSALLSSADLVKINRAEAGEVLGADATALASAIRLSERFGVSAVVTDGVHGAAACIDGVEHELAAPRRVGRFPAGSGDAFLGGLIAALDAGSTTAEALQVAAGAAERNAVVAGQGRLAIDI